MLKGLMQQACAIIAIPIASKQTCTQCGAPHVQLYR